MNVAGRETSSPSRLSSGIIETYGKPLSFHLGREKPSKTIDIGNNGSSAALEPLGSILQLSTHHPDHGIVLASPYAQFDGSRFYDQRYVRSYRRHMLDSVRDGTPGFGLRFISPTEQVDINLRTANLATVTFPLAEGISVALSLRVESSGGLVQSAVLSSAATSTVKVEYSLGLGISVNRASYGQLTEGGPISIPRSENRFAVHGNGEFFSVVNPHLGARLEGCLEANGETIMVGHLRDQVTQGVPITSEAHDWIELEPGMEQTIVARFRLYPDVEIRGDFKPHLHHTGISANHQHLWFDGATLGTFIIRRNLEYILGCLAVPVSEHHVALMTDHVALPLGWNRDNYWQLWFILNVRRNLTSLVLPEAVQEYRKAIDRISQGHLMWVFRRAHRPHAFWHRSYLVDGKPKDGPTFQLDQQCYPLLELCDFYDNYPEKMELVQKILAEGVLTEVLELLWSKQDSSTGLFPTDETPGDDEVEYPFHFSSHVLLWFTLSRVAQLVQEAGPVPSLSVSTLQKRAQELKAAVLHHFVAPRQSDGQPIFAYLCDGNGNHRLYHDANDMPTLFAVKWDFIEAAGELGVWKNTMDWGLSPANDSGYFQGGPFGGLGSVHTPDPWALGYFQEFMYAHMIGDREAQSSAWRRIRAVMLFDGSFPEAVDAETGVITSKAWFNWPGCMIGIAFIPALKEKERIVVNDG
ncbi:hypothetical protein JX266_005272 [Neoarthrinium moseri]|nr:hypothetical protein JX266_005272 [Neoarthrinium moseri]